MPQPVDVNGKTIQYPIVGESEWGVEATDFAVQVAGALAKIGQSTPPATNNITIPSGNLTVTTGNTDLGGTLDVTGATNLDSTLDVTGVTTIVDDLIVDTDTLFVDVSTDRVGINTATPTVALDVTGDVKQSGILLNSDGTVSNPSISFTNDTNTGLYWIGSDEIGIATGGIQRAKLGTYGLSYTGGILQVVSTTKSDTFSTTSSSFTDITGLSVTITPKFATSKILILVSVSRGVSVDALTAFELNRDATPIAIADAGGGTRTTMSAYYGSSSPSTQINTLQINHLDSPSSVSAITYKLRMRTDGAGTHWVNRNNDDGWRAISSITVMELGA